MKSGRRVWSSCSMGMIFFNDNALFILINDVRQSLFLNGLSRNYLVMEVTTAVEYQIS